MHLSKEIQKRLDKLNSAVKLSSTIDGKLPERYSFYNIPGRSFRAEFGSTNTEFAIVLYERPNKNSYENCLARGMFNNVDRLTSLIDLWIDRNKDISEIKARFDELELYNDFEFINPNNDINNAWTKVKNMFFNTTKFWEELEWQSRYIEMLSEAKRYKGFENYFPFTSHYWLRFSIDKDLTETWALYTYIVPVFYSSEVPETLGKFYVSYNDLPMGGRFFETVIDALSFYAEKLTEIKPTKWKG
ncbi:MAG TPA: hypothetical protein VHD83_21610 [Puia sp.]|nr:hypothetical protein [Puia sp.]